MSVIPTRDQVPQIVRVPGAMAPPRPVHAGASMSGQDVLRIVRKRIWMILLSLGICLVLAAVFTQLWLMYYPWYTAKATLGVIVPQSKLELQNLSISPASDFMDRLKNEAVTIAKSEPVLQRAIEDPRVKRTTWYQNNITDTVKNLQKDISAAPLRETNYFELSMTGSHKAELPEIVNAWAETFVKEASDVANGARRKDVEDALEEQKRDQTQLDDVQKKLQQLPDADQRSIEQTLALKKADQQTLAGELRKAQVAVSIVEGQKKMIDDMEAQGTLEQHPQVMAYIDNDPTLRALTQSLIDAQTTRDQLKPKFGEVQRMMQDLQSRIDSISTQVAERQKMVRKSATEAIKDLYSRQLLAAQRDAVSIQNTLEEVQRAVTVLSDNSNKAYDLSQTRQHLSEKIDLIEKKLVELRMRLRGEQPVYIRSLAFIPVEPSNPKWSTNLIIGGLLGLLVGIGMAFGLEFLDTSIKNPTDVSRRVELPMLGMIPHLDDLDEEIEDLRLAFMTNPSSLIGESFRQVRTTLQFSAPAAQLRTVLVTSALPGDGRSTVSLNLAAATAIAGRKVLVVDANFRQPMLRSLFPQAPEAGLSNVLVGQSHWRDLVREVHPNLFVLACGPLPPNPAELLGSDSMRTLLADLTAEYDQVIFDGAPCLLVTDPVVLSTLVDGVVLVVRASANTYGVVQRARDVLGRVGARIFGVVLNGIRVTAGGYLRKNYRTYYEYHEQTPPTPPSPQLPRKTA